MILSRLERDEIQKSIKNINQELQFCVVLCEATIKVDFNAD